jgi:hypothetical protein
MMWRALLLSSVVALVSAPAASFGEGGMEGGREGDRTVREQERTTEVRREQHLQEEQGDRPGERANDLGKSRGGGETLRTREAGADGMMKSQLKEALSGVREGDQKAEKEGEKIEKRGGGLRRFGEAIRRGIRTFGASEKVTAVTEQVHSAARDGSIEDAANKLQEAGKGEDLGFFDRRAIRLARNAVQNKAIKQIGERGRAGDSGYDEARAATDVS